MAEEAIDTILPIRGLAIGVPSPERVDDFIDFIDSGLVPSNVNTLVLRVDFKYHFRSHPELVGEDALSKKTFGRSSKRVAEATSG
jgi:hypothetical protein